MQCSPLLAALVALPLVPAPSLSARSAAQDQAPRPTLVTDVRLAPDEDAERVSLYLRDGRIAAILSAGEELPLGAHRIDGAGLYALPAFLDAFTHAGVETSEPEIDQDAPVPQGSDVRIDMRQANRKGIQPAFRAADALAFDDEEASAWREAGFGALLAAPNGELLSGTAALVTTGEGSLRGRVLAAEVFATGTFDASGSGYPTTLMGFFAQLRQFFWDARHQAELERRRQAGKPGPRPPYDRDLAAAARLLEGELTLLCEAQGDRDLERWMRLADELGFQVGFAGGRRAWRLADVLAEREIPVLLTLEWQEEALDPDGEKADREEPGEDRYLEPLELRRERRRLWEEDRDGTLVLHEAGVPFAFATGERTPSELLAAVRELVEAGLDAEVALAGLTSQAAELLGVGDRLGRLAPGYDATLALWGADPLAEEAEVRWLFVDGHGMRLGEEDGEEDEEADEDGEDREDREESSADVPEVLAEEEGEADAEAEGSQEDSDPVQGATHPIETDALREPRLQTGGNAWIQNVTVHSAVGPAWVGDVHVADGKIAALGTHLDVPAGVTELDGTGMHLAPGVIDTHSHMAIEGGINEGTLSITADCDITDVINADDTALYRALAGGVTTIQCLHGSANAIGGRSEVLKLRWHERVEDLRFEGAPQGIKFALGENPKRSNWGERGVRFPATRMGVESVFNRAFKRAEEYRDEWARYQAALEAGEDPAPPRRDLRLEVLVGILEGTVGVHSHCYRADEILMLLRVGERFGFRVQTLQHVLEGYKVAAEIAEHGAGASTFSDWWGYKVEAYDAIPQNAALLDEAGVLSTVNSDSGELVRHLQHEAAKSVGYAGLDRVRALALVTLNAAHQLGIGDRVGSIEEGKDADLALFDGDPLSGYSRVVWTMVDGEIEFERQDAFGLDGAPLRVATLEDRASAEAPSEGDVVALVGGTLHPGTGPAIENGTLLLRGGRIAAMGADLPLPVGARVYSIEEKHVWPGMIALGTSLGLSEISLVRSTVDTGEIGGNQPDLRVSASLNPDSAHLGVTRHKGITRAQVAPGGGPLRGQSAVISLEGETWEELLTRDRDMMHLSFPRMPRDEEEDEPEALRTLRELLDEAREYGRRSELAASGEALAPRYDPRLEALVPLVRGEQPVAVHASDARTILAALAFLEEEELEGVLFGALEAWKVVDRLAESGVPVVVGPVMSVPRSRFDPYDAAYANPAVLHRAGVSFAIQGEGGGNARNLGHQAAMAAAFGLPREEALRAVTYYPARILGLEGELGSLAVGKLADVVVTDGDLLEATSRVEHLFIEGREVSTANRQTELYERYRDRLLRQRERESR